MVERVPAACARSRAPPRSATGRATRPPGGRPACDRSASRVSCLRSRAALQPFQLVALGQVFHFPARGGQLAAQPVRFGPRLARAGAGARLGKRLHRPKARPPRAASSARPSPRTSSNLTSVARRIAGGRSPRSTSHATASARGTLRSSLTCSVKRAMYAASGCAERPPAARGSPAASGRARSSPHPARPTRNSSASGSAR